MKDRYEHVINNGILEEIKQLLISYRKALRDLQIVDEQDFEYNSFWLDKQTPIGLHLAMNLDQLINVED